MPVIPQPLVPDDDGSADAALASALAAHERGEADATAVLNALGSARLLVPVVAILTSAEVSPCGVKREKESEMALPKLIGQDGREAVLAFTSIESLTRWRPDARPIQATGPQVCHAAVRENAAAVVLDVAGPVSFVVEGTPLRALAAFHGPPEQLAERLAAAGATVARFQPVPAASAPGAPSGLRRLWPFRRASR